MSRYDLTPKQVHWDSIVIGWDDMNGYYARGYYEAKVHCYESDDEWTEEHEFDFAGNPFNSILVPDELIDMLGSYAVSGPTSRLAHRRSGYRLLPLARWRPGSSGTLLSRPPSDEWLPAQHVAMMRTRS